MIIGLRNILVHDYYIVDQSVIWEIIEDDLLKLKSQIEELIDRLWEIITSAANKVYMKRFVQCSEMQNHH